MRPELLAYRRAFERFTGSPDRVQQGDFQRALDLLQCIVDDDPCSLDHHGYCQTHGWPHETECYMSRTRRILARLQPKPEDSP